MSINAVSVFLSLQTVLDRNGVPIPGAKLYLYDAGTTNPRAGFQDAGLTQAHPFPIIADAYGCLPGIFVGVGAYRAVLADAAGAQLRAIDGVPGGTDSGTTPTPGATTIPTGFVMPAHTDDVFDGWLPLNGMTIGNATSNATARANADVKALFTTLWNKDTSLAVLGGRGLTATADWQAGKTLALPDYRKATLVGVAGMGVAPSGSSIFTDVIGAKAGSETITLTLDQIPALNLSGSVGAAGGHSHGGTTDANGSHSHTGSVDANGDHAHNYVNSSAQLVGSGTSAGGGYGPPATTSQTSVGGSHQHTVTLGGGQHQHGLNISSVGDHTHALSINSPGGGQSHSNVQTSIQVYFHIKI